MSKRRNPRVNFRLTEIRKERDLTLKDVTDLTGVPTSTLGDLESGRNALPSDDTLVALCDGLSVQAGTLIEISPK